MGYLSALDMKEHALDTSLLWHLQSNHYPSLPSILVGPAKRAIKKAKRGEWNARVSLRGTGVRHRRYGELVPVSVLVEGWHLGAFIED